MIRIFVGCAANNEDLESQAVLEYSIRKHASEPVEIEWMQQSRDPSSFWHGWNTAGWTTPFSGFRWGIPERCGYAGRAIYLDSDMIVQDDIAKLWGCEIRRGKAVVAKGKEERYCCTLFDCAAVADHLLPFSDLKGRAGAYRQQRGMISRVTQPFPDDENWNCCDGEGYAVLDDPRIKILHYTAIDCQPQLPHALKRLAAEGGVPHWFKGQPKRHWRSDIQPYFDRHLAEALEAGYTLDKYRTVPFGSYGEGSSDGGSWKRGRPARLPR